MTQATVIIPANIHSKEFPHLYHFGSIYRYRTNHVSISGFCAKCQPHARINFNKLSSLHSAIRIFLSKARAVKLEPLESSGGRWEQLVFFHLRPDSNSSETFIYKGWSLTIRRASFISFTEIPKSSNFLWLLSKHLQNSWSRYSAGELLANHPS